MNASPNTPAFAQPLSAVHRVYIAGPMTGYAELNFPAFHAEATALRSAGLEVVNPAEINVDPSAGWSACMRADIAQLVTCDRVHLLPGWSTSRGASLEYHISRALGLLVTLAEGAESMPDHFSFACSADDSVSPFLPSAVQVADESGGQAPAAVTKVSREAALENLFVEKQDRPVQMGLEADSPGAAMHSDREAG